MTASFEVRPARAYPVFPESLPPSGLDSGPYRVDFARDTGQLEALMRLRFEVFNVELGEGLDESYATGLDEDRFDAVCHHLVVSDRETRRVAGTYRMQTHAMAERCLGFYSADEFDLDGLGRAVLEDAVEVGRACVAREYRNRHVLFLLWKGLAAYMARNRKRYLFGCCSLTSQDPVEGKHVMDHLVRAGHVRSDLRVEPRASCRCYDEGLEVPRHVAAQPVELPKLFSLYLRYGAKVCGPPAIDRRFKTIDFLVLLDLEDLDAESRATFFR